MNFLIKNIFMTFLMVKTFLSRKIFFSKISYHQILKNSIKFRKESWQLKSDSFETKTENRKCVQQSLTKKQNQFSRFRKNILSCCHPSSRLVAAIREIDRTELLRLCAAHVTWNSFIYLKFCSRCYDFVIQKKLKTNVTPPHSSNYHMIQFVTVHLRPSHEFKIIFSL